MRPAVLAILLLVGCGGGTGELVGTVRRCAEQQVCKILCPPNGWFAHPLCTSAGVCDYVIKYVGDACQSFDDCAPKTCSSGACH